MKNGLSAKSNDAKDSFAGLGAVTAQKSFAVFDVDGTLIRWQLYHSVVDRLARRGALGKDALSRIKNARMDWKTRKKPFKYYEMELIRTYQGALKLLNHDQLISVIDEIIDEYKDQTYTYTKSLIDQLKEKDYKLLIVSGSHHEIIERLGKYYGFDDWIGAKYEQSDGHFTGKVISPAKDGKRSFLQNLIEKHNLTKKDSIAIGDSYSDIAMLEMVENPIAFNPDSKMLKIVIQKGWPIVIERKDVIYKLEHKDGSYLLAETEQ